MATNPNLRALGFDMQRCRVMDSFTFPILVTLNNADTLGAPLELIFKSGDDLRQDALSLQMFRLMERLWLEGNYSTQPLTFVEPLLVDGLDLPLTPYCVVPTAATAGLIEVVQNAETIADIQKAYGGGAVGAAVKRARCCSWLHRRQLLANPR